jgi:hypothetical protein
VTLPVLTDAARLLTHPAERITVEPRAPVIALHADHQAACLPDLVLLASMLCSTGLHVVVTGARSGGAHPVAGDVFTAMGVPTAGCAAQIDAAFSRSDPACVPLKAISPRLDTWLQLPTTDPLHRLARALAPWADPIGVPADLRVLMTTDPAWAQCALQVAQARGVNALMLLAESAGTTTGSAPRMRATLAAQGRITRLNPEPPWSEAERERQLVQRGRIHAGPEPLAKGRIAQELGNLGEDFKVLLGGRLGHQQENQQIDCLLIRCVKTNRLRQQEHRSHGRFETLDAAVWNGNAVTEPCRAQALTRKQAVGDQGT